MPEAAARKKVDESKGSDRVQSKGAAGMAKQRTLSPSDKDQAPSDWALGTKPGEATSTDKAWRWKADPRGGRQRPREHVPLFLRYDAKRAKPSWG